ncbi:MAG: hypothetical protein HYX99_01255, partial [Chloroflexi bacterium]|nr:hypothetical protein [Chloroflexota bacterium]
TGSTPIRNGFQGYTRAPIPGWQQRNVTVVEDILQGKVAVGQRVVIYDTTSHIKGPGIAEYLAELGKQVELIVRTGVSLGAPQAATFLATVVGRLARSGVKLTINTEMAKILEGAVVVVDKTTGRERTIEGVDTIVLSTGNQSNASLYFALKGKVKELHRIGDCVAPNRAPRAIHQGYYAGRML